MSSNGLRRTDHVLALALTSPGASTGVLPGASPGASPGITPGETPGVSPGASPVASSAPLAASTIYFVQTITALITSTAIQLSTVTECPSAFSSPSSNTIISAGSVGIPLLATTGPTPSGVGSTGTGPCPGQGYTCDDCLDHWFCPPIETPALPAPCGYGWPCYHCDSGWFCVPLPHIVGVRNPALPSSTSTSAVMIPTLHPATNGFQYVGCYADNTSRALSDSEMSGVAGGMTNAQCIDFCQAEGYTLAGTEFGTECYCGSVLVGSILLPVEQCNKTCAGDPMGSTMCGGSWALSIWSPDGTVQHVQSPDKHFTLPITSGYYHPGGVRVTSIPKETVIHAWPPLAPTTNTRTSLKSLGVSDLELSILAAVAPEASGLALIAPASASGVIQSVSSLLNMGMSSIASSLAMAASVSTGETLMTRPSAFPLGPGPVVPSTTIVPTAAPLVADENPAGIPPTTMAGSDAINLSAATGSSNGSNSVNTALIAMHGPKAPIAFGPMNGRRAPRRRSH